MTFEQVMTLGGMIVQVVTMVLGGLYALAKIDRRLELLVQETGLRHSNNIEKFNVIDKKLNELVASNIELVKQEIRMNHLDERLQELSNRVTKVINGGPRKRKPATQESTD